ncbi:MAG: DNA mismatch repair endonuclease MutL [Candidatus Wallbacteria bacterium]|nr:DNA mismatch repair endonuclease MutL [Candidatus Wallbacteria bacterium]
MGKIIRLNDELINKIAAGEIIERPGNVVKELVENSLDSEASRISIEIKDGGSKVIQVADNGCGMQDEDLLLAFERHATSKLGSEEDLYRINTLGFRGEALPSIAGVSKLDVYSREHTSTLGNYLRIEGGQLKKIQQMSCNEGTSITVRDLFYNTPARKKFLKSAHAESHGILEILLRYVLGFPEVAFTLVNNSRVQLKTAGNLSLQEVLGIALGNEVRDNVVEVNHAAGDYPLKIRGFVGKPNLSYPRSGSIYFLVNRRYIRSNFLLAALLEGYRGYLMVNKYPAAVLCLEIAPEHFDINVHPSKLEIKFVHEKTIFGEIVKAVSLALTCSHSYNPGGTLERERIELTRETGPVTGSLFPEDRPNNSGEAVFPFSLSPEFKPEIVSERFNFSEARIIGQFNNSYLLCEWKDELILLDQHAAHEKVLFETLREMYLVGLTSQPLLIPVVRELPPPAKYSLLERREAFAKVGIQLEDFGGNTIRITEIPAFVNQKEVEQLFEVMKQSGSDNYDFLKEELIKKIACHRAVKNGDPLRPDEMISLLKGLEKLKNPFFCPHGRPVMIRIGVRALDKMFRRI